MVCAKNSENPGTLTIKLSKLVNILVTAKIKDFTR